jgi:ATP-dependent DNA helicase PIF1
VEKLDIVCQYIRNKEKPFGGIQIVFVGDFMQLPPVFKGFEEETFAFESTAWKESCIKTIQLTEIVRQHGEPEFAKLLNEIRFGKAADYSMLLECVDRKFPDDGIKPVKLFCKNVDVSRFNLEELKRIKRDSSFYYAQDMGGESWSQFFDKNCHAPTELELRIGAQVILLVNLDVQLGLVNGSVGIVENVYSDTVEVKFATGSHIIEPYTWEIKQNEYDAVSGTMKKVLLATRKQIPLKLAWALTIHKSQGSTLDRAEIDVSEAFADGQTYVALSRVRSLKALKIRSFSPSSIRVSEKCMNFYKKTEEKANAEPKFFEEDDVL